MPDPMGNAFQNPDLDEIKTTPDIPNIIVQGDGKNELIQQLLKQDSYLEYLGEDESSYQIRGRDGNVVVVSKKRYSDKAEPAQKSQSARDAFRWLALAVVGLAFSGLGALLFAPVSILNTFRAENISSDQPDQVRRLVIRLVAILLLIPAVFLAYLFWLHLRP